MWMQGHLSIRSRDGADHFTLAGSAGVGGNVKVDTGAGNDLLQVNDSNIGGTTTLKTGSDNDAVHIEDAGAALGPHMTFPQAVTVNTGSGDDSVTVGVFGQAGNTAFFSGGVRLDGGAGNDTLDALANGNPGLDAEDVRNFEVFI